MPIPFLVAGAAIAGIIGAGSHLSAKDTNERARKVSEDAKEIYDKAKYSLQQAQNKTERELMKLGYQKKAVLDTSMKQFLTYYDKVKHIQVSESIGLNELSNFTLDSQGVMKLRQLTDIYSDTMKSGATGAAAGAIVALAASGSLTVVTGGLASAGSALLAGQVTAAAGIAGSALSFGAAMTPLAAVAAPVILFTGISASMKADENLEKANAMLAEAEAASEKMKVSETLCYGISERAIMFNELLTRLNQMFTECSNLFSGVVKKREGIFFKRTLKSEDFTEDELKLMAVTRSLAGAVKAVIDTPIISKDGQVSKESENLHSRTTQKMLSFHEAVEEVKKVDYNAKPLVAKPKKIVEAVEVQPKVLPKSTVLSKARNLFAILFAFLMATGAAEDLGILLSKNNSPTYYSEFLNANQIAVWILLFSVITVLIGRFRGGKLEKALAWASGIAISTLFVQYSRSMISHKHPIIISIVVLVISGILFGFFDDRKEKLQFGLFFSTLFLLIILYPLGFFSIFFLVKVVGVSFRISLMISTAVVSFFSFFGFPAMLE